VSGSDAETFALFLLAFSAIPLVAAGGVLTIRAVEHCARSAARNRRIAAQRRRVARDVDAIFAEAERRRALGTDADR
jgi:hypothetical protein